MLEWIQYKLNHGAIWRWLLAAYWLTLLVATHLPSDFPILPPERVDKVVHLAAYALFAFLLATAWQASSGKLNRFHLWAVWLALVLYGAVDEVTQIPVGRYASVADWLADAVGAAAGLMLFVVWQYLRRRRTPPAASSNQTSSAD